MPAWTWWRCAGPVASYCAVSGSPSGFSPTLRFAEPGRVSWSVSTDPTKARPQSSSTPEADRRPANRSALLDELHSESLVAAVSAAHAGADGAGRENLHEATHEAGRGAIARVANSAAIAIDICAMGHARADALSVECAAQL